jgi:hypothetical protein
MNQTVISFNFNLEQINLILAGLAELPLKVSGDFFTAIKNEAARQIEEANNPPKEDAPAASAENKVEATS